MLDFRIMTFLELCKQNNYTKTAHILNITQPTVTQHIQYLEQLYNTKLIQYEGRKLNLTPEGELLKNVALSILADNKKLTKRMQESKKPNPQIRLGATMTIGEFVLPPILENYLITYTNTELSLVMGNTAYLLNLLKEGQLDCAFVEGYLEQSCFESRLFMNDEFIPVCGYHYPFEQPPKTFAELLSEPLLLREIGSGTREILERVLHERALSIHSFPRNIVINNLNVIQYFCQKNLGITFLYQSAAKVGLLEQTIKKLYLTDFQMSHPYYFVTLKNSVFSQEYTALFEFTITHLDLE